MSKYLLHPTPHFLSCTTPLIRSHHFPYTNTCVTFARVMLGAETCGQVLLSITVRLAILTIAKMFDSVSIFVSRYRAPAHHLREQKSEP